MRTPIACFLAGCNPSTDDGDGPAGSASLPTTEDSGPTPGTPDDTLPTAPTLPGFGEPGCAAYSGAGQPAGTTLTFEVPPDAGFTGGWTAVTTLFDGELYVFENHATYEYPYGTVTTFGEYAFRCDAVGVWALTGVYESRNDVGDLTYASDVVYDPPALVFPVGLDIGSTWEVDYVGHGTDSFGYATFDNTVRYEIVEEVALDLPIGSMNVAAIDQTAVDFPDTTVRQWFDRALGFVAASHGELASFEAPAP